MTYQLIRYSSVTQTEREEEVDKEPLAIDFYIMTVKLNIIHSMEAARNVLLLVD